MPTSSAKPTTEYVLLVALLTSIGAMGTDIMLPALDVIGAELGAPKPNDVHHLVITFFLGMGIGQLIVGPLSDSYGRKPVIYGGYAVFILGCILSMVTESWSVMLLARVLQGLGAAAPRIVSVALVRDAYEGRAMARVMSIVMAAFITVPILAPAVGQGLIAIGGWKSTFLALAVMAVVAALWFSARLPESLPVHKRRRFSLAVIWTGIVEILRSRIALGYTIATGMIFGLFTGYLGSAQQIFEITFDVGALFPMYFAIAAASIGAAALLNAVLIMRLGMRRLTWISLVGLTLLSFAFWAALPLWSGTPPLMLFLAWQIGCFFCIGVIFGNFNALALEPLGHIAGLGAAFVGSIATFISLPLADLIGQAFDGTVTPLVAGFALLSLAASAAMAWANRGAPPPDPA